LAKKKTIEPTTASTTKPKKPVVTLRTQAYRAYQKCNIYKSQAEKFISSTVYPSPLAIIQNQSLTNSFLDPNVKARITPVGAFDNILGVIEYFYGLTSIFAIVSRADVNKLVCDGDVVSVNANLFFPVPVAGTSTYPNPYNLTVWSYLTFNPSNDLIVSVDASILNFGMALDQPNTVNPATNVTYHQEKIAVICGLTVYGQVGDQVLSATGGTCTGNHSKC
jgi:hypothetical protein